MPDYSDFVNILKKLHLKRKGNRPKVAPQKFYPSQVELQTQELIREELGEYGYRLADAAAKGGVQGVYDVPGAVPQGFDEKVQRVAEAVSLFQVRAFANFSELAVGERYFPGGNEQRDIILNTWSDNFVNLCKSTNEEMRKKVAGVVSDGVLGGRNIRDLTKDIQNTCSEFTRNKAELIATTEVGKLNTAIARNQSESAGIQFYEWSAAMDGRTRESHAIMDGKICKWGDDDGFYVWEQGEGGKRKLVRRKRPENAYKGAPGTDFRCRCTALPYVPEYEDDYEAEREKGPVQGVTQGEYTDPATILRLNELEFQRNLKENPKKEAALAAQKKIREDRLKMLYRMADKYSGVERDAYIRRRTADQQNYLADVMEYKLPGVKDKKRMSDAFKNYCRPNGSKKINDYLVSVRNPKNDGFEGNIRAMEDWIGNNPMPENKVLYRAIRLPKEKINEMLKNRRVVGNGGFQSFSAALEHSASFIDKDQYGVLLKVNCKKGDKIAPPLRIEKNRMVGYSEEQEYDALPNATFKVNKSSWKGKICYIDCEFEE